MSMRDELYIVDYSCVRCWLNLRAWKKFRKLEKDIFFFRLIGSQFKNILSQITPLPHSHPTTNHLC